MKKKKTLLVIGCFVVVVMIAGVGIWLARRPVSIPPAAQNQDRHCEVTTTQDTVSGQSMDGILADGETISVLENYYACHPVERNDIVVYAFGIQKERIVKRVVGMPGDMFGLQKNGTMWNIMINGSVAVNASGTPYVLDSRYAILSLYAHDYKGIIPADSYIILGNVPSGSLDSTRFGLVSSADFVGKVAL